MLINARYFTVLPTKIAGIDTTSDGQMSNSAQRICNELSDYIGRYEPKFLRDLLGREIADRIDDYPAIKMMLANSETGESVIAKYVYFFYTRDHATFSTMSGEKVKLGENSRNVSENQKLVLIWNDMVNECRHIVCEVDDVQLSPNFTADIFEFINQFNL